MAQIAAGGLRSPHLPSKRTNPKGLATGSGWLFDSPRYAILPVFSGFALEADESTGGIWCKIQKLDLWLLINPEPTRQGSGVKNKSRSRLVRLLARRLALLDLNQGLCSHSAVYLLGVTVPKCRLRKGPGISQESFSVWLLWPLPSWSISSLQRPQGSADSEDARSRNIAGSRSESRLQRASTASHVSVQPQGPSGSSELCRPQCAVCPPCEGPTQWVTDGPRGWLVYSAWPGDKYQGKAAELPQRISDRRSNPVHNTCDTRYFVRKARMKAKEENLTVAAKVWRLMGQGINQQDLMGVNVGGEPQVAMAWPLWLEWAPIMYEIGHRS
ncbi:hypothetical protein V8F33_002848 [Rhypophila sp. PSN 637]